MANPLETILAEEQRKRAIWNKGAPIENYDAAIWRRDAYDNPIRYGDYGNRASEYGWEIDHIIPIADGGTDHIGNLRPLQWAANVRRN